jgi:hypothetical protein
VDIEYSNTVCFQTIAGIQEFSIRADMNVSTSLCVYRVGSADFYRPYFFRVYNWEHVYDSDDDSGTGTEE